MTTRKFDGDDIRGDESSVAMHRSVVEAFVVAAIVSGVPSTAWSLATGHDPLEATRAAGLMLVDADAGPVAVFAVAAVVHLAVSAWWTAVLARTLPARAPYLGAGVAALLIAGLDLLLIGRHIPSIRALALGPQIADHLAFTLLLALVLDRRGYLAARDVRR